MAKATPSAPSVRPKRTQQASSKVVDPANIADAQLRSHKDAIIARRIAEAALAAGGPDGTRSTSEKSGPDNQPSGSSPRTALTTAISSSELPTTAKHANPMTEADSDSDFNDDHDATRHRTFQYICLTCWRCDGY